MKPLVSIITPAWNRAYVIQKSIDSVLAQTYAHWELIVIDDGSTDNTAAVVRANPDRRIRYHHQPNAGPAAARNRGLDHANGEWIAHLDSDDQLRPRYLEVMLRELQRHPHASFAALRLKFTLELYQNGDLIATRDQSGIFPPSQTLQDLYHHRYPFYTCGFMHHRRLISAGARFDPALPGKDDWDMLMQMGELEPEGYLYVPETLADYHQNYGLDGRIGSGSFAANAVKLEAIWRKHRYDRLMRGQTWYPAEAEQWRELERRFQAGELPPANLYLFPELWPKHIKQVYNRPLNTAV